MNEFVFDDIEIAPPSVVKRTAHDFAAALAETPQFKTFEQAAERFRQDQVAQQAMQAYEEKQISWRALLMLNASALKSRLNWMNCTAHLSISLWWRNISRRKLNS